MTDAERAFLNAGRAYCAARREAFDRAFEGTPRDYDDRAAVVDSRAQKMLRTVLDLAPRSQRDNGSPVRVKP